MKPSTPGLASWMRASGIRFVVACDLQAAREGGKGMRMMTFTFLSPLSSDLVTRCVAFVLLLQYSSHPRPHCRQLFIRSTVQYQHQRKPASLGVHPQPVHFACRVLARPVSSVADASATQRRVTPSRCATLQTTLSRRKHRPIHLPSLVAVHHRRLHGLAAYTTTTSPRYTRLASPCTTPADKGRRLAGVVCLIYNPGSCISVLQGVQTRPAFQR